MIISNINININCTIVNNNENRIIQSSFDDNNNINNFFFLTKTDGIYNYSLSSTTLSSKESFSSSPIVDLTPKIIKISSEYFLTCVSDAIFKLIDASRNTLFSYGSSSDISTISFCMSELNQDQTTIISYIYQNNKHYYFLFNIGGKTLTKTKEECSIHFMSSLHFTDFTKPDSCILMSNKILCSFLSSLNSQLKFYTVDYNANSIYQVSFNLLNAPEYIKTNLFSYSPSERSFLLSGLKSDGNLITKKAYYDESFFSISVSYDNSFNEISLSVQNKNSFDIIFLSSKSFLLASDSSSKIYMGHYKYEDGSKIGYYQNYNSCSEYYYIQATKINNSFIAISTSCSQSDTDPLIYEVYYPQFIECVSQIYENEFKNFDTFSIDIENDVNYQKMFGYKFNLFKIDTYIEAIGVETDYKYSQITFNRKDGFAIGSQQSIQYFIYSEDQLIEVESSSDKKFILSSDICTFTFKYWPCCEECNSCSDRCDKANGHQYCIGCASNYYTLEDDNTVCLTSDSVIERYYYNVNDHIFRKCVSSCKFCSMTNRCIECDDNYQISDLLLNKISNTQCVPTCPSSNTWIQKTATSQIYCLDNQNECKSVYNQYLVYDSYNNYECTPNCNYGNYIYIYNQEKCVEDCSVYNKYYVPISISPISFDLQCLDSCSGSFPYYGENYQCLNECPNFYLKNNKKCVDSCNYYHEDSTNKECIDTCDSPLIGYLIYEENTNLICYSSCPTEYQFLTNPNTCYNTCLNKNEIYVDSSTKKCQTSCTYSSSHLCENICSYNHTYLMAQEKKCVERCTPILYTADEEFFDCGTLNPIFTTSNNAEEVINSIKDNIILFYENEKEIKTSDYFITITDTNEINSNTQRFIDHELGYVDLQNCVNILKDEYDISPESPIIILFLEEVEDSKMCYNTNYTVFSKDGDQLDISKCQDENVKINAPIRNSSLIDLMKGEEFKNINIDIFNIDDSFFNDICTPFSSNESTDVTIENRIKQYYQNSSFCSDIGNCRYISIDYDTKRVNCNCDADQKKKNEDEKKIIKDLNYKSFIETLKNTTLNVCFCYKLVFSSSFFKNNYGGYLFTLLVVGQIACFVLFKKDKLKPIMKIIKYIIERKTKRSSISRNTENNNLFNTINQEGERNENENEHNQINNGDFNEKKEHNDVYPRKRKSLKKIKPSNSYLLTDFNVGSNNNNNNNQNNYDREKINDYNNMHLRDIVIMNNSNEIKIKSQESPKYDEHEDLKSKISNENNNNKNNINNNINNNNKETITIDRTQTINKANPPIKRKYVFRSDNQLQNDLLGLHNNKAQNTNNKNMISFRRRFSVDIDPRFSGKANGGLILPQSNLQIHNQKNKNDDCFYPTPNNNSIDSSAIKNINTVKTLKNSRKKRSHNNLLANFNFQNKNNKPKNMKGTIGIKIKEFNQNIIHEGINSSFSLDSGHKFEQGGVIIERKATTKSNNENNKLISGNNKNGNGIKGVVNSQVRRQALIKYDKYIINFLNYEDAIIYDKRHFCQIFRDILFLTQDIAYSFFYQDKFNLRCLSISLFIFSLSLNLAVNCIFYDDEDISHAFYLKGKLDIIYNLPQAIYSMIISVVLDFIIELLTPIKKRTLNIIFELEKKTKNDIKNIFHCLKIKLTVYYSLILFFEVIFWYYISAFCIVFPNSQKIFFILSAISFGLEIITRFFYAFFITIIKYISIKCKCKNIYRVSDLLF